MHEEDSSSSASSRQSPLGSPRTKPHAASPSLLPVTLEPIVEDAIDLKTSFTTEQVRPPHLTISASTTRCVTTRQDVLFGAQHLKAKALGLPSLAEMQGHDVHLLTCSQLPHGWVEAVGGLVAARSVRY
jgi:hypothetical protein